MLRSLPRSSIAFGLAALLVATAVACTSNDPPPPEATPSVVPAASVPPTGAPPQPTASPSATPRPPGVIVTPTALPTATLADSRAIVDEVIEAVRTGDVGQVETLLKWHEVSCTGSSGTVPPPACLDRSTAGPLVAFPAGVCVASWHADPQPILQRFVERAGPLIAVTEHPEDYLIHAGHVDAGLEGGQLPPGDFRVAFEAEVGDQSLAYVAVIGDGAILFLELGCRSPRDSLLTWLENPPLVVVRGPAYRPEGSTPVDFPDPLEAPRGEYTGEPTSDRIIEAIRTGNADHVIEVLRARRMQCTHFQDIGSPPPCDEDELEATVVDAFLLVGCEGSWARADLSAAAIALASRDLELYAIVGEEIEERFTLFVYASRDPDLPDTLLYVSDGSVIGYATLTCSTAEDFGGWYPVQFRGPAWPADPPE